MKWIKVFKLFKKGARVASGAKGKPAEGEFKWPDGIRVGVFGHANSGKTVYFTVLNEETKISKDLGISVNDHATAAEFLANHSLLWGIGASSSVGTMVDLRKDKEFPESTQGDKLLQFSVILDRDDKIPVVTLDYDGNAVSISKPHELKEKLADFMTRAHGLVFFFDPKVLGAVVECQAHIASFVNVLEQLAPLGKRLPIPVALVVSKADVLPGFSGENQTLLISGEDESVLAHDFEIFLEKILASNRIASDTAWAGTVRDVLVKMREFLKVVVGRTLDFQVFFISATGTSPVKVGTEVGRSIYVPPDRLHPVGVIKPFYWIIKSILHSRRVAAMRRVTRFVVILSLAWLALMSLPYMYHFGWLLPRTVAVEDQVVGQRNRFDVTGEERSRVMQAFGSYRSSRLVKLLFEEYVTPAQQIRSQYDKSGRTEALKDLEKWISQFKAVATDRTLWPKVNQLDGTLIPSELHTGIEAGLKGHHQGDSTTELYQRSDRALELWELLKLVFANAADEMAWNKLAEQVAVYRQIAATELSDGEKDMHGAIVGVVDGSKQRQVKEVSANKAGGELEGLERRIENAGFDYDYLLGEAVRDLTRIRNNLGSNPSHAEDVSRIDDYLRQAKYFDRSREYSYMIDYCPDGHHVHVTVVPKGQDEVWPGGQIHPGRPKKLEWKAGDVIIIALDPNDHDGAGESLGKDSKVKIRLDNKFALFQMRGEVTFPNGQNVTVNLSTNDPVDKLPKL